LQGGFHLPPVSPLLIKRGEGKRKLLPRGGKIKKAEGRVGEKLSGLFPLLLPLKREGWEGFSIQKFFVNFYYSKNLPPVSPLLIKRGEGKRDSYKEGRILYYFPSPSQGEGEGGVAGRISSPPVAPSSKRGEGKRDSYKEGGRLRKKRGRSEMGCQRGELKKLGRGSSLNL